MFNLPEEDIAGLKGSLSIAQRKLQLSAAEQQVDKPQKVSVHSTKLNKDKGASSNKADQNGGKNANGNTLKTAKSKSSSENGTPKKSTEKGKQVGDDERSRNVEGDKSSRRGSLTQDDLSNIRNARGFFENKVKPVEPSSASERKQTSKSITVGKKDGHHFAGREVVIHQKPKSESSKEQVKQSSKETVVKKKSSSAAVDLQARRNSVTQFIVKGRRDEFGGDDDDGRVGSLEDAKKKGRKSSIKNDWKPFAEQVEVERPPENRVGGSGRRDKTPPPKEDNKTSFRDVQIESQTSRRKFSESNKAPKEIVVDTPVAEKSGNFGRGPLQKSILRKSGRKSPKSVSFAAGGS